MLKYTAKIISQIYVLLNVRDTVPLAAAYTFGVKVIVNVTKEDSLAPSLVALIPSGIQFASSVNIIHVLCIYNDDCCLHRSPLLHLLCQAVRHLQLKQSDAC